ncbi:MAG: hypothetical protein JNJ74_04290 [Xanthomonadales bacterium]|nr:hypothetical protein [Xanthomonadales bacterium]
MSAIAMHPANDGPGVFRIAAANSLLLRYGGLKVAGPTYEGLSTPELLDICAERLGDGTRDLDLGRKITRLLGHTSSDFPGIATAVARGAVLSGYAAYPTTWREIAAVGTVPDFKEHSRPQVGGFGTMDVTPEGGEHSSKPVTEDRGSVRIGTRGRLIRLTRAAIRNDEMFQFIDAGERLGTAAARSLNTAVFDLLTSGSSGNGPTLADGGQLFNTTATTTAGGHANLAGSGGAISATTLAAAKLAMRKQTDRDSTRPLGIRPRTLLVPQALEEIAWGQAGVNAWGTNPAVDEQLTRAGRLRVVSEPELDAISATAWYLAADPSIAPLFEVAFLDGRDEPVIEEAHDWDTDSIVTKCRFDYGFAVRDFRPGYRNAGA